MSSRYLRADSPTGRRLSENPTRSSTGAVHKSYDTPRDYTTKETYTSPRASGERVVPISKETYVNGKLVESSRDPRSSNYGSAHSDRHHHRRSTYDQDARAPPSSSAYLRPTAVSHGDRGPSADRSSTYDDRYSVSTASSAPRKEQRHLYSVDDGKLTRISGEPELRRRDDRIHDKTSKQPSDERSKAYHLRGTSKSSASEAPAYEYTDPRGMYETTEPRRRARRGSVDAVMRERPASMADPYQTAPRLSAREIGPPPSTRGFNKVNNDNYLNRSGSLQAPYKRSPSRSRGYTTSSSTFSDDENYRVPPRIATGRDDPGHYPPPRSAGLLSPTRGGAEDYYEPRRRSRFEDREVASRGFGIRAPSVDARSSADSGVDKYSTYTDEPLMIEAPPPPRRDYPVEPRAAARDDPRLREPDWREDDRHREKERDIPHSPRDSPPLREREKEPLRERDSIRDRARDAPQLEKERDYAPRDSNKNLAEPRRDRDRERDYAKDNERLQPEKDRESDRSSDEGRQARERRSERDYYDDDRRERDRQTYRDDPENRLQYDHHHDHHHAAEAVAGTAAIGAAALGGKEMLDKRNAEDRRDFRDDREPVRKPDTRESRPAPSNNREEKPLDKTQREREPSKHYDDDDDDVSEPRRRNYVSKEKAQESFANIPSKHSEILDPEEDYRRRVQQVQQEMSKTPVRQEEDSDRDRRRREQIEPRDIDRRGDEYAASEPNGDRMSESQVLTRYGTRDNEITESPRSDETSEEAGETAEAKRKKRVSIVDPAKDVRPPKSILRKPTEKFPEDPNPIREGVAPLKDAKISSDKNIPQGARWTQIKRSLVNPQALEEKGERFEEREDFVVVLRVLDLETVQKYTDRTKAIRDARYAERKEQERRERGEHRSSADEREQGGHHHSHEHDRRDKEGERERERHVEGQDRDKEKEGARTADRYKPEGY
ncbi:MAG: hypothetical protein Q9162_005356 [Coniocarpon cinnabarinum]